MSATDINDAARMIERANDNIAHAIKAVNESQLRDAAWHLHQAGDLFERAHYAKARAERAEDQAKWDEPISPRSSDFMVRPIPPFNAYGCSRDFDIVPIKPQHAEVDHA